MRIGVDVMGGDHAPQAVLDGALGSLGILNPEDTLFLYGDEDAIRTALRDQKLDDPRIRIVSTHETVDMAEPPVEAVRTKPESSLVRLARDAGRRAEEPLDAILSAGNTGAMVSAAQMYMRRLPNVHRPGIAVILPTFAGPIVLIDVGANIEPKPHHLMQYGVMGSVYAQQALGMNQPRVGLMNVGGEEQKGTDVLKRARDRLRTLPDVNFIGYIEGRGMFEGEADVVITDGIVGNVMLKLAEGLSAGIFRAISREIMKNDPELAARFQPVVESIYRKHDYHEYGGAPLLGVNGTCLICHGSSEARTIHNAIRACQTMIETGVNDVISHRLGVLEEAIG